MLSASSSVCVPAQSTAQVVQLPPTGGVSATLNLTQYDVGATGCQNVTIATGAAAVATASSRRRPASSGRNIASTSTPAPLLSITLGQGLSSSLGLTTVFAGATLTTGPNLVFPDGTYLATATYTLLGQPITVSLVFTAKNGVLTITAGDALPIILKSATTIQLFDRGVTPPGFALATPTPAPTALPSASPSPVPTPTPTGLSVFGSPPPAAGTVIGTYSYTYGGTCPAGYPYACSQATTPLTQQATGDAVLRGTFNSLPIFYGTVTFNYNLAPFVPASMTTTCPSSYTVTAGAASMIVTIPAPVYPAQNPNCIVTFSTLPAGAGGSYYTQVVGF